MRPRIALRILKKTSAHETRETNERGANGAGQVAPTAIFDFFRVFSGRNLTSCTETKLELRKKMEKITKPE
jgi:hypothetical protein